MNGQSYGIQWIQHDMKTAGQMIVDPQPPHEEDILASSGDTDDGVQYLVDDDEHNGNVHVRTTSADIDQIAAENLIFMARDGQMVTEIIGTDENGAVVVSASDGTAIDCEAVMQQAAEMSSHNISLQHEDSGEGGCDYTEEYTETTPQMVTEEVITDDWVQHQGEERVEISADQIIGSSSQVLLDIEVPLPTMQDEYTALRPYPCDFCSRRFRKKTSLNNHMVAHQHDRPNLCKLCGSRFFRRGDLLNHLKAHAEVDAEHISFVEREHHQQRHHHANDHYYDQDWTVNTDAISGGYHHSSKPNRKSHNASGNSSSTSTSTTVARRGRISRLKPKEENYTINETLAQSHSHQQQQQQQQCEQYANVAGDIDYVEECQELQASTAAVKLTQDHSPAHQRHYPIIDDSKPFVCQQCGLAFAREKALLSHAKNHRNDLPHECNQCNEMFWDTATLQEHQKSHHFEESNSEYDPEEAEDTQSESESERLYGEFYCSECGMSFHRQDVLRRHTRAHHKNTEDADPATAVGNVEVDNSRGQHCCNTCGETFAEALDLLAHAEIHARYPPFKCVLCGETFFEEHTIKRHLQSQHAGEMTQNSCILCGKECRDRKALIKHAWDHSREKCHSCSKCGKNFHNKARLKRHMASHRDKSVMCDVCHEEFPDGRTLSNHRHSHSATASGKLFPCHECGKTFGSRSSQQIHVRIHTGERPYGCRFCWKAFADGGTLRKHERIHTGEKPYACAVCPRAFNQRVVLREHIRSHHSGLDAKRGTYFCTVCTADLSSSNDLIQHLIQHSDMNTAMQRQPVTGPRKYKRRRKLKPHEIAHLRSEGQQNGSDIDISDFDIDTVDDLLGITTTNSTINGKSNKKSAGADGAGTSNNNNNNTSHNNSGKRSTEEGENDEDVEDDGVDRNGGAVSNKARYNSASSNSDKIWQTKLINSNDETYKSMLSNLENTLQSIDTLVVSSSATTKTVIGDKKSRHRTNNNNNINDNVTDRSSTAQRTQQVQIIKMETKYATDTVATTATTATTSLSSSTKTRKKPEKSIKLTHPRMIHTEKSRIASSDGSRKRSKTYITRTEPANIELLPKSSSSTMVDDYEIISPDTKPPNQISSSPLHIKQENEQHLQHLQQQHHHSHTLSSRNGDLYDAQLLLEASTLRKAAYEKFNPSIVNDLEEILRSPIKSDRGERLRFTSESSSQFLVEPAEEEQHLIKIEPISPDLQEIVVGNSTGNSSNNNKLNTAERRSTRSTRSRLITANRKYLEFETDITSNNMKTNAIGTSHQQQHKRNAAITSKSKAVKIQKKDNNATISPPTALSSSKLSLPSKSYLNGVHVPVSPSSSFASISAVVSAADANAAATAAAAAAAGAVSTQPERKQRYYECEMCSAIFPDRAQLLDHVPIHI